MQGDLRLSSPFKGFLFSFPRTECPWTLLLPRAGPGAEAAPDPWLRPLCWAGRAGSGGEGGLLGYPSANPPGRWRWLSWGAQAAGRRSGGSGEGGKQYQPSHRQNLQKTFSEVIQNPPKKTNPGHQNHLDTEPAPPRQPEPAWCRPAPALVNSPRCTTQTRPHLIRRQLGMGRKLRAELRSSSSLKRVVPLLRSPCPGAMGHGSHCYACAGVYYFSFYCAESPLFPACLSPGAE